MRPIPDDILRAGALGCPDDVIYGDGQEFATVPDICNAMLELRGAARVFVEEFFGDDGTGGYDAARRLRALLPEEPS